MSASAPHTRRRAGCGNSWAARLNRVLARCGAPNRGRIEFAGRLWYNPRSFSPMGVIRFRRDMWRSDRASRMSVGLVNHPAKQ